MAQKVQVVLVDDLDGGPADDTVTFGLDGIGYEIDLTSENAARLRSLLAPYVDVARRTGGRKGRTTAPRSRGASDATAIRAWAKQAGVEVSERGRISAEVRAAYDKAH
jgi:hypothetical protein